MCKLHICLSATLTFYRVTAIEMEVNETRKKKKKKYQIYKIELPTTKPQMCTLNEEKVKMKEKHFNREKKRKKNG